MLNALMVLSVLCSARAPILAFLFCPLYPLSLPLAVALCPLPVGLWLTFSVLLPNSVFHR